MRDDPIAALGRAADHVEGAYGRDGAEMFDRVVRSAWRTVEDDDALPLPIRWAVASATLLDASVQTRSWPLLSHAFVIAAQHAASSWRTELTIAATAIPDAPP